MYKKTALFIILLFTFGKVDALWYQNHIESYRNLSSSPYIKECWYDGDSTGWVWLNGKDRAVAQGWSLMPLVWSIPLSQSSWNMNCIYRDNSVPVVTATLSNYNWSKIDVTSTLNCIDAWWSWCDPSSYQIRIEDNPFTCDASWTWWALNWWITHTFSTPQNTNLQKYFCFRVKDRAQVQNDNQANPQPYSYTSSSLFVRIDKTLPRLDDIIPNSSYNHLLAVDNFNYELKFDSHWWYEPVDWSPISTIDISLEKYNNAAGFDNHTINCVDSVCKKVWNISNVDNDRTAIWGRIYTYRLRKICDESGNCWTWTHNLNHNVYANNILPYSINSFSGSFIWINISDWSEKSLNITLKDTYGNALIPASWISRKISFDFDTENQLYLNEYDKTWNWVFLKLPWASVYGNLISIWVNNKNFTFSWIESNNWTYRFLFKIYTPTKNTYNKAFWNFIINNIDSKIYDNLWAWVIVKINQENYPSTYNIDAKYKPIYYTSILWEFKENGFSEWSVQSWNIRVTRNSPSGSTSNNKLYIEFWSWDTNEIQAKLNLKFWTSSWTVNQVVWEWNPNWKTVFQNNFGAGDYPIYTKLLMQTWARLNDIQHSYFSTHIWYDIVWANPWETLNILHNSDIFGKNSYWENIWSWNTYESIIKIIWSTYTKKFEEIMEWQEWEEILLFDWNISKMELKSQVRKKAFSLVRNVQQNNGNNKITDFNFSNNADWVSLLNWDLIYFWSFTWANKNVEISAWTVSWNKSIIIIWWNAYIKWNIETANWWILWIAVLQDINGSWWNIYVDPNVTHINASLYADKALISYYDSQELWANAPFYWLRNQLYINWAVFTENTVGWSRSDPVRIPYYMKNIICLANSENCMEDAQKYDLNYLRRYYLKDTDWDWIWDQPAMSWTWFFASWSVNYKYPLIIEYNPLLQTNPPIIFRQY